MLFCCLITWSSIHFNKLIWLIDIKTILERENDDFRKNFFTTVPQNHLEHLISQVFYLLDKIFGPEIFQSVDPDLERVFFQV